MHGLDVDFMQSVQQLYVPEMGTDVMAPLLYWLVRFARPMNVLEAGCGYTSPFIAKALSDNLIAHREEQHALVAKSQRYVSDLDSMDAACREPRSQASAAVGLKALYRRKISTLADRRTDWMFSDPALARPGHYLHDYRPRLHCVDSLSIETSSANRVRAVIDELGLGSMVSMHEGDIWSCDFETVAPESLPFDFMWLDLELTVKHTFSLLNGRHWNLLNPNGGILLVHCLLSTEAGQVLANECFKRRQRQRAGDFELLGLFEPQRVLQNNCLMLRKTSGCPNLPIDPMFLAPDEHQFEEDARQLVRLAGRST